MHVEKYSGTDAALFPLVGPLVMNPAVLRFNNNYPFKTTENYVWYVALEESEVVGFIPVRVSGYMLIDNYYAASDNEEALELMLGAILADMPEATMLSALVHLRHEKVFTKLGFVSCSKLSRYVKMQYQTSITLAP